MRDEVFAQPQMLVDFAFNEAVADVFPDMIRRSVPGYESIISLLGVLGQQYIQPNTYVYDLGCSLGAATLSLATHCPAEAVTYVAVDNSSAMVKRCEQSLQRHLPHQSMQVLCEDVRELTLQPASLIVLNFTLQFIDPDDRLALLQRLYQALLPGGALVLSEKLQFESEAEQQCLNKLYMTFKRANGYSELEISQKRTALENVLIPDSPEVHEQRLQDAGFEQVYRWFQSLSFASFVAVKAQ